MPIYNRLESYEKLYCNFRTSNRINKKVNFEDSTVATDKLLCMKNAGTQISMVFTSNE